MPKKRTKKQQIVDEIAYDLNLKKGVINDVLKYTFKEIAITLILKKKPVMIRKFFKIVVALRTAKKVQENLSNLKTRLK